VPEEQEPHQRAEGEGIAQAFGPGATAISNIVKYEHVRPQPVDPTLLEEGRLLLESLPLDRVPETAPPPPGSKGPPIDPNPLFVGREDALKELAAQVMGSSAAGPVKTVCVSGIGGVGKTQLASEFAHCYGQYFQGGVYWLNLSNPGAAAEEIAGCGGAGAMDLRSDFDRLTLEDQVRSVKAAWLNELPRLLVLDNCEDAPSLQACRPMTGGCRVLLTNRGVFEDPALAVTALELDVLDRGQSMELLRSRCPGVQLEETELAAVAEELGCLPLALDLAGRYLYEYRDLISPSGYVEELRAVESVDHPSLRRSEGYSPTNHELDVGRTFVVNYQRLDREDATDRLAIRLLAMAARFAPGEPIDRNLLLATLGDANESEEGVGRVSDAYRRFDALRRLTGLGLVGESEAGLVRMHRLVASFVRREVEDPGAQESVERVIANAALNVARSGQPLRFTALLPHLRHATDAARDRDDESSSLVRFALGSALNQLGSYAEAVPYLESAVNFNTARFGATAWLTMRQRNDLGVTMKRAGDLDGALGVYEPLLEDRRNELQQPHEDVASTLINIGSLNREQGLLHEVLPRYEEALDIRKEVLERMDDDPERKQLMRDVAESHNNLGALSMDLGRPREAAPRFGHALDIYEELEETLHERYANTTMGLGAALWLQGDLRGARCSLKRALCVHRRVLQEGHPQTARNLILLGALLDAEANRDGSLPDEEKREILGSARTHLDEALTLVRESHGEDHPLSAGVMRVAAGVAVAEGRHGDATSLRERANAIRKGALEGEEADFLATGAEVFAACGLYDEALIYQERSLELRRRATQMETAEVAAAEFALSCLLQLVGRDGDAEIHLEQALLMQEKLFREDHPAIQLTRESLLNLRKQDR